MIASAPSATSSSLGSGTVIDGDGKIYAWVSTTQRARVKQMLQRAAVALAENLAADTRCLVYSATVCTDQANFTPAQRLAAATLAVEASDLALDKLDAVKIHLMKDPPVATGDDGRDTPVNARVSPDTADTIDIWFDYAKDAEAATDLVKIADFQHTLVHELIHMQATAGQGGKKVGDIGDYGGVPGRRLVNRAAGDIVGGEYGAQAVVSISATLELSPQVSGDIDGKANEDTVNVPFSISFGSFSVSQIIEVSVTGGSYKLNGALGSAPAGKMANVTGTGTFPLRAGTTKLRVRAKDETGREVTLEKTLTPRITAPPMTTMYRFHHNTAPLFGYSGTSTTADSANWTLDGPSFLVPQIQTRSCKKPVYLVVDNAGQYFSASTGAQVGYGCDAVSATKPLYELSGAKRVFTADPAEIQYYLGLNYTNHGSVGYVIK